MMLTHYIADVERGVSMKNLSLKEAQEILQDMKVNIPIPRSAETQIKRNIALDMAVKALNCSEIPNSSDSISRQAAIDALGERPMVWMDSDYEIAQRNQYDMDKLAIETVPPVTPKQQWIPVTLETLPNPNSIVVVCGKKGTWDFGMYSGWYGDVHSWKWKKNTIKHVYWWMYKTDALPEPYREEGENQ